MSYANQVYRISRQRISPWWWCVVLALLAWPWQSTLGIEPDVEQVVWGFDGQVVSYRFNTLSILLNNPTAEAMELRLRLTRSSNASADRVGAKVEESVFLSPFASRWVQFYPYVSSPWDEWTLSWGLGPKRRYDLPKPTLGRKARILLTQPDRIRQQGASLKSLPDNLFPPLVSATENLEAVFLDYAPRWQEARRQALLDWLYRGGRLYVMRGEDGSYPEFTGQLAMLNAPLERQRVGSGLVTRLDRTVDGVDMPLINELLPPPLPAPSGSATDWDLALNLFSSLREMTAPEHSWPVIHFMSLVYLALVFPGWYLLSSRRADYRTTMFAFLGVAIIFTFAFHLVGKRGYGESTTVNSVAIARPVSKTAYDVLQWSNVFVTDGDNYLLQHPGVGHLYSTCQNTEAVNGVIDNGIEGAFLVDIPLFSSRSYLHRGKINVPTTIQFTIEEFEADETLDKLVLVPNQPLPEGAKEILALYRDAVHPLKYADGKLSSIGYDVPLPGKVKWPDDQRYNRWNYERRAPEKLYHHMQGALVGRALGLSAEQDTARFQLPDDRLTIFLYAPMTQEFTVQHEVLGHQRGHVMYAIDIPLPHEDSHDHGE